MTLTLQVLREAHDHVDVSGAELRNQELIDIQMQQHVSRGLCCTHYGKPLKPHEWGPITDSTQGHEGESNQWMSHMDSGVHSRKTDKVLHVPRALELGSDCVGCIWIGYVNTSFGTPQDYISKLGRQETDSRLSRSFYYVIVLYVTFVVNSCLIL